MSAPTVRTAPARLIDVAVLAISASDAALLIADNDPPSPFVIGCAVVAVAALCIRRRAPYLVFAATIPALVLSAAAVASLVALYTVAEKRTSRIWLALCATTVFACYMGFWEDPPTSATALLSVLYSLLFAGAPVVLGLLTRARADLSTRLVEIENARRVEQELLVEKALARERADLAREMHDVVSHQVSLIAVQAGALEVTARDEASMEAAGTIRTLSVQTLNELRDMVGVLRAPGSAASSLTPQPCIDDIPALVAASGISTTLDMHGPGSVTPAASVQRATYRAVQEGLTNVAKHAPGAAATLQLHIDDRRVELTLTNTGPTRAPDRLPSDRNGLLGLRERAELLGGTLHTETLTDGGYRLSVQLPLHG